MARYAPKRAKRFSVRTQVLRGRRTRIGLVIPGLKRVRPRVIRPKVPETKEINSPIV